MDNIHPSKISEWHVETRKAFWNGTLPQLAEQIHLGGIGRFDVENGRIG
jgi:hypothetical protein